jgi:outer membrane protein
MKMIKILAASMMILMTCTTAAQSLKIGVVSIREVANKMPQRQALTEQLKKEFASRNDELQKMANKIKEKQAALERDQATMTEGQVTQKRRELEQEIANFKLKEKAFQEDYKRRGNEEFRKLQARIQQAIEAVAKRDGYDLILVRDQIPYSTQKVDITDDVLKVLNGNK